MGKQMLSKQHARKAALPPTERVARHTSIESCRHQTSWSVVVPLAHVHKVFRQPSGENGPSVMEALGEG